MRMDGLHLRDVCQSAGADAAGPARGVATWLALAAAPTFAVMALLTVVFAAEPDTLCAALHGSFPLSGMAPMYGLMSAFHVGPWLKLAAGGRRGADFDESRKVRG
jgi:hypothetical protein